jgi:hypothetical protein
MISMVRSTIFLSSSATRAWTFRRLEVEIPPHLEQRFTIRD